MELVQRFKDQFNKELDAYKCDDITCAYASGMLLMLSAMIKYDGPSLPTQVRAMHKALREIGEERGWLVSSSPTKPPSK